MTPEEFVKCFAEERLSLLRAYHGDRAESLVAKQIDELQLSDDQLLKIKSIVETVVTDTMYTILLALDGEAALGSRQEQYKLLAEDGTELTASGLVETYAWEYFHGPKKSDV